MQNNPMLLICGLMCIYPLLFFALPAFLLGKSWGRIRFRSPIAPVERMQPAALRNKAKAADPVGYGAPR